jgi:DivIVA domain-containing protein
MNVEKTKLSLTDVLNKEFNIDFKGYSASDVDAFLDIVLEDYQIYDRNIKDLSSRIVLLENKLTDSNNKLVELNGKEKGNKNSNSYNSVDLLKRVSRLEQEIFKNK